MRNAVEICLKETMMSTDQQILETTSEGTRAIAQSILAVATSKTSKYLSEF